MLDTYILPPSNGDGGPEAITPAVHVLESEETYGKVSVEPLPRGFGPTIGNPLRRILLSSTGGSAITWVKIEDAVHEYAPIPGVKEEVMELLLNIKRIRIRAMAERAGKMRLDISGQGRICAGDIATSNDFQIVNPQLHLATLDSDDARLAIEFNVEQGVGYKQIDTSEERDSSPVGVLPLDAVFNPVRNVKFEIAPTRVGQDMSYERLVLEVWTDGTIKPVEAVHRAAESLVNYFFLFSNLDRASAAGMDRLPLVVSPEVYQTPVERLGLTPRTLNCLKRAHVTKVGEILEMTDEELLKIRNLGEKSLEELHDRLNERGIAYRGSGGQVSVGGDTTPAEWNYPANTISAEDLGELMAPGSGLAPNTGDDDGFEDDEDFEDDDLDDEEDY